MRRTSPSRGSVLVAAVASAVLILTGAGSSDDKPANQKPATKTKKKEVPPKVDETIGDVANIFGRDVKVEGVGLVIGLDGTGAEPAPSWHQKKLVDEMQKAGLEHPERLLNSVNISLVVVRAVIPAGVSTKDRFDIDIELTAASATSSLAGGFLMSTRLAQRVTTKEGDKDDKVIATAMGPVMCGNQAKPNDPKVARVLGGGRVLNDALYLLSIKELRRSGKTSQLIENVVKQRFHQTQDGRNEGMVKAKTDSALELRVPKIYHHNQDRYHLVISHLSLVDNPNLRQERLRVWGKELLDPKRAGLAALKLEGLGPSAAPVLKEALGAPEDNVRYFAAEALAYLNDGDGAAVLYEMAKKKPEFRLFAFKALAAMDQAASLLKLRALMSEADSELRYAAFDALRTLDPTDPFLGRIRVIDPVAQPDMDEMAVPIVGQPRKKPEPPPEDPFKLYVVDSEGPPLIHVSGNTRCEIVIFGKSQKMLTPIVLGAGGPLLLNASDGDEKVQICKITTKNLDAPNNKVNCTLDLAQVLKEMANLGASYPDVVSVIHMADKQKNLQGPFEVDKLPVPTKAYDDAQLAGVKTKKDDNVKKTSGKDDKASSKDDKQPSLMQRIGKVFGQ
jgi:hypothetical protein